MGATVWAFLCQCFNIFQSVMSRKCYVMLPQLYSFSIWSLKFKWVLPSSLAMACYWQLCHSRLVITRGIVLNYLITNKNCYVMYICQVFFACHERKRQHNGISKYGLSLDISVYSSFSVTCPYLYSSGIFWVRMSRNHNQNWWQMESWLLKAWVRSRCIAHRHIVWV